MSVALVYFIKSWRNEPLDAGPAFALFAGFILLSNYVASYPVGGVIYLTELRAVFKRIEDILLIRNRELANLN